MTGLEAIALKLEEKRKSDLENILSISGSSAIAKNEYGVTVVDENNVGQVSDLWLNHNTITQRG